MTDRTHRKILTMTASDEWQNTNLVHQSLGNKAYSEQAQMRCITMVQGMKPVDTRFFIMSHQFWSQKSGHLRQELSVFLMENEWFRIFTWSRSTKCLWRPFDHQRGPRLPMHTNSSGFNTIFLRQKVFQEWIYGPLKLKPSKVASIVPPFYWWKTRVSVF